MNRKIISGLLAGIMAFSVSTAAFADTTAASENGYSIALSQVISKQQKTLTVGGKASSETVYTVPYGSAATIKGIYDSSKAAPGCDIYPSLGGNAYGAPDWGGMSYTSVKFDNTLFDRNLKGYLIKYYVRVYEGDDTPYVYVLVSDQKDNTSASIKNCKIDTGAKLTVNSGKTYQFKITASTKPTFACGNGSAFKVTYVGSKGHDYFFKAKAVGKAGQATGFYVNGEKTPCTVGTIA